MVQWFISTGGSGSIPGRGTEIPHAKRQGHKLKQQQCVSFSHNKELGAWWWWFAAVRGSPLQKGFPPCFPSQPPQVPSLPTPSALGEGVGRREMVPTLISSNNELATLCVRSYICTPRASTTLSLSLLNTLFPFAGTNTGSAGRSHPTPR